jgi:uncharacterized protein involved in cysteine biosynthesis
MGNHGALFRDVRKSLRQRRRIAFGFGSGVAVLSSIPVVNLFIMPVAVAGATALYVDHLRDTSQLKVSQLKETTAAPSITRHDPTHRHDA